MTNGSHLRLTLWAILAVCPSSVVTIVHNGGGGGGSAMDSVLTSTDDVSKSGPWLKVKTHCRCHCPWSWTRSNSSFPWKWMIIGALMECWLLALGQRHSSLLVLMHCIGMCISHTTTYLLVSGFGIIYCPLLKTSLRYLPGWRKFISVLSFAGNAENKPGVASHYWCTHLGRAPIEQLCLAWTLWGNGGHLSK